MPDDKIKNVLSITANDNYLVICCLIDPELYSECNTFLYDRKKQSLVNIEVSSTDTAMSSPKFIKENKFIFLSNTGSVYLYDINMKKASLIEKLAEETFDTIESLKNNEVYVKNYGNGNVYLTSVDDG